MTLSLENVPTEEAFGPADDNNAEKGPDRMSRVGHLHQKSARQTQNRVADFPFNQVHVKNRPDSMRREFR